MKTSTAKTSAPSRHLIASEYGMFGLKSISNRPLWTIAAFVLAVASLCQASTTAQPILDAGYRGMYNLDFADAHARFAEYEQAHPQDPFGHVSNAAAYLFSEFDRLRILEFDLFTVDSTFEKRPKAEPDPAVKAAFDRELEAVDRIASEQLAASPNDTNALLSQIMANGLRGDYAAMIDKRNIAGLSYMKNSRELAEKLLALDPNCYDAYLAVGVENYLLSLHAAPIRWILRIGGAETDKAEGVQRLRLTAEKGHYLAPFARVLLAVAAMRDKDIPEARKLLQGLVTQFPQNTLYKKELARIPG
jgi:hypothetical protein